MPAVLFALLEQHLHADADAEERDASGGRFEQHGHEAAVPDLVHGGPEGAVPGQYQGPCLAQPLGIAGQDRRSTGVPETLGDAAQVAIAGGKGGPLPVRDSA
jgi:hypothetical protein